MNTSSNFLSVHVYYNVHDLRPLIVFCVAPLVKRLRSESLIRSYFFIRYWQGGAHVRLRVLPQSEDCQPRIRDCIDTTVAEFLREQPSVFDLEQSFMQPIMKRLFISEYGEAAFTEQFGKNGAIPLEPNNSWRYTPYEPEYGRYGGKDGVALAERHFAVSSDIALEALRDGNNENRSSVLGLSMQMMLTFAWAFLEDRDLLVRFFRNYANNFHGTNVAPGAQTEFERQWDRQNVRIIDQIRRLHSIRAHLIESGDTIVSQFSRHASQLRDEVRALFDRGQFEFKPAITNFQDVCARLAPSYLHMMNNRLGLVILEEVYMANMLARSIESATEIA